MVDTTEQHEDRHESRAQALLTEMTREDKPGKVAVLADALASAEIAGHSVGYMRGVGEQDGQIRVVRLLEYVYPDAETMARDMERWYVKGTVRGGHGVVIRSATLPLEVLR